MSNPSVYVTAQAVLIILKEMDQEALANLFRQVPLQTPSNQFDNLVRRTEELIR